MQSAVKYFCFILIIILSSVLEQTVVERNSAQAAPAYGIKKKKAKKHAAKKSYKKKKHGSFKGKKKKNYLGKKVGYKHKGKGLAAIYAKGGMPNKKPAKVYSPSAKAKKYQKKNKKLSSKRWKIRTRGKGIG